MVPTRSERVLGWCLLAVMVLLGTGCNILGFAGAMEESRRRNSTHAIKEQYTGLKGKKWAVVVLADRIIQADHPSIVPYLTTKITERLADAKAGQQEIAAAGYVPADR